MQGKCSHDDDGVLLTSQLCFLQTQYEHIILRRHGSLRHALLLLQTGRGGGRPSRTSGCTCRRCTRQILSLPCGSAQATPRREAVAPCAAGGKARQGCRPQGKWQLRRARRLPLQAVRLRQWRASLSLCVKDSGTDIELARAVLAREQWGTPRRLESSVRGH